MKEASLDQRILELFRDRKDGFLSGEELSAILNVSRTAVWKHIKSLKELGYRIDAIPSRGYRLTASPDILLPAEISAGLRTKKIGSDIICFRDTDSTNAIAFRLAEDGAPEGTVVLADSQTKGKGRLGRLWASPPKVNLYCSIILRPPILPMKASQLTFLSSVAVARSVLKTSPLKPQIKWPNDILINGMKVAGLLNEMSAETEKVNFVILGVGVNINMRREQFPADLRHPASSLFLESGVEVNRNAFIRAFLEELDALYEAYLLEGYPAIRREWLALCNIIGKRVRVSFQESETTGIVTGIDDYGALLLELGDGSVERVLAGDVTLIN